MPNENPILNVARLRPSAGIAIRGADWPMFWRQLCARLRQDGYRPNTLRVYRQILRDLRAFLRDRHDIARPGDLTEGAAGGQGGAAGTHLYIIQLKIAC